MATHFIKKILICSLSTLAIGCATKPIEDFEKIKMGMLKDEVIEILGDPTRAERFDGKDKWAYKYFTGEDKNIEALRYVTFYDGKVIAFGIDADEAQRREEIRSDYETRKERKKATRAAAKARREKALEDEAKVATDRAKAKEQVLQEEEELRKPPNFKDVPGTRGPIKTED